MKITYRGPDTAAEFQKSAVALLLDQAERIASKSATGATRTRERDAQAAAWRVAASMLQEVQLDCAVQCEHVKQACVDDCRGPAYCPIAKAVL